MHSTLETHLYRTGICYSIFLLHAIVKHTVSMMQVGNKYGMRACTEVKEDQVERDQSAVCPSAPVESLNKDEQIFLQ